MAPLKNILFKMEPLQLIRNLIVAAVKDVSVPHFDYVLCWFVHLTGHHHPSDPATTDDISAGRPGVQGQPRSVGICGQEALLPEGQMT